MELDISKDFVGRIIREHLNYRKICARWVSQMLIVVCKQQRLDVCNELLVQCYDEESDAFLGCIITSAEMWIHWFELEAKRQSMQ